MKKIAVVLFILALIGGCSTDAEVASRNLSNAADMFEIDRRVVFYNGITGEYMLAIEGRCSLEVGATKLAVICKTGPNKLTKHYLGLSDNVTFFAEQLGFADVSEYHHRVIFKPQSILPNVDLEVSGSALTQDLTK
jgi:hypothetical protein